MKKEILFNICIFLVCLVISLPFFSANAMASNIISAHAQGQDQIPSYRMPADFTEIIVDATIDDDPAIGETQLAVSQLLITQFDECKQLTLDGIYRCTYKSNNNIKQGSTIFTIDLMDDEGLVVDTKTTEITVDDQEPEIELFEIQQNQNNFTASYKITDSACLGIGCEGKCSGFKKIEFYSNEELLKKLEVNSFSGICTLEGSEKLEVPQGDNTINMLVYDNLDNIATSETIEMKIDLQAPKVLATIDIFDAQGYKVTVLGKTETTGNILKAYIQDDNLDPKTVYADISELISDYYDTSTAPFNIYNKKPATKCEETQSNVWECEWFGLILAVKSDGEKTLTIEASDTNNHKATSSVYYLLSVDKSDSQATLLRSSFKKETPAM